ncbi:MAG: thioredoxin domain-containing protein [Myxococcota bacterium]
MANALARSHSPYLRQHAENPVDWVEWGPAAFAEARRRDVPLLVSIGYATCHWCHVMAHESFEDEPTARLMNERMVCVKVDREELPEVDEIYMDAVQALTGHGGWPLNAFVDHDGRPFYAGTYFPREHWQQIVAGLSDAWTRERGEILRAAADIAGHIGKLALTRPREVPADVWGLLAKELEQRYDADDPGFAHAPKFPPSQLLQLLVSRPVDGTPSGQRLLEQAEAVLEAMQDAGLHERVGGGFHRYSTDAEWRVPHFEKMLYDQAQLIAAYALAGARLGRADFLQTARNAADYVLRDLRVSAADGSLIGYASAEDADDPGGEGSFYAWSPEALRAELGADAEALVSAWDLRSGERHVGRSGHLEPVTSHIPHPRGAGVAARAAALGFADAQALRASWEPLLPRLRAARDRRPRPIRDDKVLTDLNGLMLAALGVLGRVTGERRWADAARELAAALVVRHGAGGLERMPGRPAYVTDYGHLALGLVAAYRLLGEPELVRRAVAVVDEARERLAAESGGFYTTPAGRGDLIRRSVEHSDNAYPAGAHALALAAVRLGHLTSQAYLTSLAAGVCRAQAGMLARAPSACATLLQALFELERGATTVVVSGPAGDPLVGSLLAAARRAPRSDVSAIPTASHEDIAWPVLEHRKGDAVKAYVCEGTTCRLPTASPEQVTSALVMR